MHVSCPGAKDCGTGGSLQKKREMERQAGVGGGSVVPIHCMKDYACVEV